MEKIREGAGLSLAMVESMDFGKALAVLRRGGRVYRDGWNGKAMWLCLIPGNAGGHMGYEIQPCIGMKTAGHVMQPGWLASQADMLAEDWRELV